MMKRMSVGSEMESNCGRCKMVLNHVITAMVDGEPRRVKCLTCGSEHNHRATKTSEPKVARSRRNSESTTTSSKSKTSSAKPSVYSRWTAMIANWDQEVAKAYSIYDSFRINDCVTHSKFGNGIVVDIPGPDRMIALFESGEKMLMQGKDRG